MDMARATRARIECLSCHRCHLFRMAERTCGHRAEHNIRARISGPSLPPGAAVSSRTGEQRVGVRCSGGHTGGGDIHPLCTVNLHMYWDRSLRGCLYLIHTRRPVAFAMKNPFPRPTRLPLPRGSALPGFPQPTSQTHG